MKVLVVYDDTGRKSEVIADIIGDKGFADVVVKRRHLEEYYRDSLKKVYPDIIWKKLHSLFEYADFIKNLELYSDEYKVIHCFSNYFILDEEKTCLSLEKLAYIDNPYGAISDKRSVLAMFPNVSQYISFCKAVVSGQKAWDIAKNMNDTFEIEGLVDIGDIGNFIQCITGNFESRYFNSLKENEFTLEKSSTNKQKIKAEYYFYHLLPEDMKYWFVLPFNYQENGDSASYTMERLHMTDLAIKWVHGSMEENEFAELMDKYFFFFKCRHASECTLDEYSKISKELYIDKVHSRIDELKSLPEYIQIKSMLEASSENNIDSLVEKYFRLKEKVEKRAKYEAVKVIGHGDPCFANALYNKSTKTLKFIDPKGALSEEELWTNPYYDVAKLSHSICGRYDFFNNDLFEIKIDKNFCFDLDIPFDNSKFVEIFRRKAEENGFDYWTIRVYEASLFLSMLPLHIDNPHKVLGFILNAKQILMEIEENV